MFTQLRLKLQIISSYDVIFTSTRRSHSRCVFTLIKHTLVT